MKRTTSFIGAIIDRRNEEVACIVSADANVISATADLKVLIDGLEAATSFKTSEDLACAINHLLSMEQDATYRVGFADGMRLAQELKDLDDKHKHIFKSMEAVPGG
jgi:UDP-N-acetylmuramyl tripeptide synthase